MGAEENCVASEKGQDAMSQTLMDPAGEWHSCSEHRELVDRTAGGLSRKVRSSVALTLLLHMPARAGSPRRCPG